MNLREFGSWAINEKSVSNPEPNYKYKGQCVSLIQQYLYHVFNIPFKSYGNAKDWEYNYPTQFIKLNKFKKYQRGDILVYGNNYGGGYGHLGFIDANWKFFDQNGVNPLKIGYREKPFIGYKCILRNKNGVDTGDNIENVFWVKVNKKEAAVRNIPSTSGYLNGSKILYRNDTFQAIDIVVGENVYNNNLWYKSKKGNYIWSGGLSKI